MSLKNVSITSSGYVSDIIPRMVEYIKVIVDTISQNIKQSIRLVFFPNMTAVVFSFAFLSGIISGTAEYRCMAPVQKNNAIIISGLGVFPVCKYPNIAGVAYNMFDEKSSIGFDLNLIGGILYNVLSIRKVTNVSSVSPLRGISSIILMIIVISNMFSSLYFWFFCSSASFVFFLGLK